MEDQDPESKLEVGTDMRKIHHCFHYLKVNLSISTTRSPCLLCSNCNKAFLVDLLLKGWGASFPFPEQYDLWTTEMVQTDDHWISSEVVSYFPMDKLRPWTSKALAGNLSTFYTKSFRVQNHLFSSYVKRIVSFIFLQQPRS